jgi:hypothetical protein
MFLHVVVHSHIIRGKIARGSYCLHPPIVTPKKKLYAISIHTATKIFQISQLYLSKHCKPRRYVFILFSSAPPPPQNSISAFISTIRTSFSKSFLSLLSLPLQAVRGERMEPKKDDSKKTRTSSSMFSSRTYPCDGNINH